MLNQLTEDLFIQCYGESMDVERTIVAGKEEEEEEE
jgi:hypothetical protein